MKILHKFFWNRWYMYIDSFYYRFFVDGMIRLLPLILKFVENPLDKAYHERFPSLFERIYNKIKHIQTGDLSYNMIYIILIILLLLAYIFMVIK